MSSTSVVSSAIYPYPAVASSGFAGSFHTIGAPAVVPVVVSFFGVCTQPSGTLWSPSSVMTFWVIKVKHPWQQGGAVGSVIPTSREPHHRVCRSNKSFRQRPQNKPDTQPHGPHHTYRLQQ